MYLQEREREREGKILQGVRVKLLMQWKKPNDGDLDDENKKIMKEKVCQDNEEK